MKRHSLFTKLLLGNLLLVGMIVLVGGAASYGTLNRRYQRESESQQTRTVRMVRLLFERMWSISQPSRELIDAECDRLPIDLPARVTVIAADGWVLGDSQADPATMANHKTDDRPEILAALAGGDGRDLRPSDTLKVSFRYFAEPIRAGGSIVAVARVAMPVRHIAEGSELIRNAVLFSALVAAAAAVGLTALVSWLWYKPIRQIALAAKRIASGSLVSRLRITGPRELAELATALNEMRHNLNAQINRIAAERSNLQTVVASLREGLIALDAEGVVVLLNDSARQLLAADAADPVGRGLQQVVRVADLVEAVNQAAATGRCVVRQIEIRLEEGVRTAELLAAPVAGAPEGGIAMLVVVRDVTAAARMAKVKAEFAANASHELRTPLATIRAAVDSLRSAGREDDKVFDKFVDILDRHTRRLEELTGDLLDLHLIETAKQRLTLEPIDGQGLARQLTAEFAERAARKGLSFEVRSTEDLGWFTCDRLLVGVIARNLIDNALKFTSAGGRVECRLTRAEGGVQLSVSDTGCGIPPELHERVFERFFQADAARSGGGTRGTGLGLAIVKHAVERLGGRIRLESAPGSGTTVTVLLPAAA